AVNDDAFGRVQRLGLVGTGLADAIPARIDFRSGFGAAGLSFNNGAAISGTRLRLTDGGAGEACSVFFVPPLDVRSFVSDFAFQLTNANAEGFTFTLQRSGPTAVGLGGGGLGYDGVRQSLAIKFDLAGSNDNSTGLFTNGTR